MAVPTATIAWGPSAADGAFAVRFDAGSVPADFVGRDGSVNVEIVGWAGGQAGTWHEVLRPAADAAPATVRLSASVATPDVGCIAQWVLLDNTSSSLQFMVEIAGTYPYGSQTGSATFDASNTDTFGVGVSATGAYGSWSANGTSTTSEGSSASWSFSTIYRYYQIQEQYAKYGYGCMGIYTQYKVSPYSWTGGTGSTATTWKNYTYCAPEGAGVTFTRSSASGAGYAFSLSGGVGSTATLGISLSSSVNWTMTHTITYYFPSAAHACGNNAMPAQASDISGAP